MKRKPKGDPAFLTALKLAHERRIAMLNGEQVDLEDTPFHPPPKSDTPKRHFFCEAETSNTDSVWDGLTTPLTLGQEKLKPRRRGR